MRSVDLSFEPGSPGAELPVAPGWEAGISRVSAGDMALSKRATLPWRAAFFSGQGLAADRALGLKQVHSRRVIVIDGQSAEECARIEADAMVTDHALPVLTVTVADCLPVLISDTRTGAFGIAHSGWRGTGIVVDALRVMAERFGTRAEDCGVTIGPGIGACCYEVPEDRAAAFEASFGPGCVVRGQGRGPRLDLRAANIGVLDSAGVRDIVVVRDCTRCSSELGSFRRQGPESYTLMLVWIRRA